ncbi:DNA polymerase subunit gamma-2, mitochondrial [Anthophora plagiata]
MTIIELLKELSGHFINFTEHGFTYGPQGRMLLKNLEEHWFLHCVTMSRYNVFLSDEFSDTLNFITKTATSDVPFGLATVKKSKHSWMENASHVQKLNHHRTAEVAILNNEGEAEGLFRDVQKERKIWWRRLAQCPSRFKLTEAKKGRNVDTVDIKAQFSFGNVIVERISYHSDVQKLFQMSEKDFSGVRMVEHVMSLDWGSLALLCDARDAKMHVRSMLAPHKVAFRVEDAQSDDLNRFVLYLNNMLKTRGLSTILTSSEEVVEACLVPFVVSVDTSSLENGIVRVRDRSTTLYEAVHITDLAKYLIARC